MKEEIIKKQQPIIDSYKRIHRQGADRITQEKALKECLGFFITKLRSEKNSMNIIITDLGRRLYKKMVADGILEDTAYTDLNLAAAEYKKRKKQTKYPKINFVFPDARIVTPNDGSVTTCVQTRYHNPLEETRDIGYFMIQTEFFSENNLNDLEDGKNLMNFVKSFSLHTYISNSGSIWYDILGSMPLIYKELLPNKKACKVLERTRKSFPSQFINRRCYKIDFYDLGNLLRLDLNRYINGFYSVTGPNLCTNDNFYPEIFSSQLLEDIIKQILQIEYYSVFPNGKYLKIEKYDEHNKENVDEKLTLLWCDEAEVGCRPNWFWISACHPLGEMKPSKAVSYEAFENYPDNLKLEIDPKNKEEVLQLEELVKYEFLRKCNNQYYVTPSSKFLPAIYGLKDVSKDIMVCLEWLLGVTLLGSAYTSFREIKKMFPRCPHSFQFFIEQIEEPCKKYGWVPNIGDSINLIMKDKLIKELHKPATELVPEEEKNSKPQIQDTSSEKALPEECTLTEYESSRTELIPQNEEVILAEPITPELEPTPIFIEEQQDNSKTEQEILIQIRNLLKEIKKPENEVEIDTLYESLENLFNANEKSSQKVLKKQKNQ